MSEVDKELIESPDQPISINSLFSGFQTSRNPENPGYITVCLVPGGDFTARCRPLYCRLPAINLIGGLPPIPLYVGEIFPRTP